CAEPTEWFRALGRGMARALCGPMRVLLVALLAACGTRLTPASIEEAVVVYPNGPVSGLNPNPAEPSAAWCATTPAAGCKTSSSTVIGYKSGKGFPGNASWSETCPGPWLAHPPTYTACDWPPLAGGITYGDDPSVLSVPTAPDRFLYLTVSHVDGSKGQDIVLGVSDDGGRSFTTV